MPRRLYPCAHRASGVRPKGSTTGSSARQAFAAGANGPDSSVLLRGVEIPAPSGATTCRGLGNRMHEENTGAFLHSLMTRVSTRPQVEYALGFLSHYATDTVMHPYVCALCQPRHALRGPGRPRLP